MEMKQATRKTAEKVIELLGHGLTSGLGEQKPGQMCVEAAVCYAMGLPHGDEPICVSPAIRAFKIKLNDCVWSSNQARADGMRRLAIAQLNSAGAVDDKEFVKRLAEMSIRKSVPYAFRAIAKLKALAPFKDRLEAAANRCEAEGTRQSALDARDLAQEAKADAAAYVYAAAAAARDKFLAFIAEEVVQILIDMKAPGTEWLDLAPLQNAS